MTNADLKQPRELFFRLGQTLESLGRVDEAMDAYLKELASRLCSADSGHRRLVCRQA